MSLQANRDKRVLSAHVSMLGGKQCGHTTAINAGLSCRTPYVDVCDDADYSQAMKGYGEQAKAAGVPAITSAGTLLTAVPAQRLAYASACPNPTSSAALGQQQ